MPRLLVSVRSADEARAALAGGASIIDVKEPANGPLGRASFDAWREVARAVDARVPTSVALGELPEWLDGRRPQVPGDAFAGLAYCKLGLAGAGPGWAADWEALRAELPTGSSRWIAVAYTDWRAAAAPRPTDVLRAALSDCVGLLFDTWDKSAPARWEVESVEVAEAARRRGLMVAIAGGMTTATVDVGSLLRPEVLAVRGAACRDGDRMRDVETHRVRTLADALAAMAASDSTGGGP
ncbi:(5-formylfuran-3-yl)methyl phosphate synthase [Paludisphaera soli]|uniref:(5-formylfuran-3-yl)methyl phosphate synthase n=1 Tax=Paludisphaera soli TaxID=2712865 RepID=UPI0013EDFF7C|nr:(5-formylfuran-3-yl)methyl phosphate synthase [Paludisphaera soli]